MQCTTCAADIFTMSQDENLGDSATTLEQAVTNLTATVASIQEENRTQWKIIGERLNRLEKRVEGNGKEENVDSSDEDVTLRNFSWINNVAPDSRSSWTGTPATQPLGGEAPVTIQSRSLKWEYETLCDSVSRVKLPPRYRMNDSKIGINAKDKEQAAILVRNGRFIETGMKLLLEAQKNWGDYSTVAEILDGIMLCMTAHMRYVQEHNSLYVVGQYGSQAKSVFKSIQRITSNLQPEDIEDLKTTVSILLQQTQSMAPSGSSQMRGGFRQQNNRFRGGNFRGFRGRGGQNQ